MGLPVDPKGFQKIVDSVAAGSTSSGADSPVGGLRSPFMDQPWDRRQELMMNESLRLALVPAEEIRKIRPIVPQAPFPEEGIAYDREALTIEEAVDAKRWQPSMRAFVSGSSRPYASSEQDDAWSGSQRNVSSSVNPMM